MISDSKTYGRVNEKTLYTISKSLVVHDVNDIRGVDRMMETLRNWEKEFVCVGYSEGTECSSVSLHSVVLVSVASVIVLSDSPCKKIIGNWEAYPILKDDSSLVRV
jgi:hypothetical protein